MQLMGTVGNMWKQLGKGIFGTKKFFFPFSFLEVLFLLSPFRTWDKRLVDLKVFNSPNLWCQCLFLRFNDAKHVNSRLDRRPHMYLCFWKIWKKYLILPIKDWLLFTLVNTIHTKKSNERFLEVKPLSQVNGV